MILPATFTISLPSSLLTNRFLADKSLWTIFLLSKYFIPAAASLNLCRNKIENCGLILPNGEEDRSRIIDISIINIGGIVELTYLRVGRENSYPFPQSVHLEELLLIRTQ